MPDMFHFPYISYVSGGLRVEIDLRPYGERFAQAQQWLGDRVLEDCKACMPLLTGSLQQRSHTEDGGRRVVFPGPYARYQYMGKVMVDSKTGKGPRKIPTEAGGYVLRFRKGAELEATDKPLKYSNPQAKAKWFEHAKQQNKQFWMEGVAEILKNPGGK